MASHKKKELIDRNVDFETLRDGYRKAVDQGHRLLEASLAISKEYPDVALGLAEIGQEEIGKSMTLLASFGVLPSGGAGHWCSMGWQDHQLKAHRAFIYEFFWPLRLEMIDSNGNKRAGFPIREKICHEKEASFYINYSKDKCVFLSPRDNIDIFEWVNRINTLLYLSIIATSIRNAIEECDEKQYAYHFMGSLALRLCTEQIYQQERNRIFKALIAESPWNREILHHMFMYLNSGKRFMMSTLGVKKIVHSEE